MTSILAKLFPPQFPVVEDMSSTLGYHHRMNRTGTSEIGTDAVRIVRVIEGIAPTRKPRRDPL